jgi:GT2 family glycosyltransferase
VDIEIDVFHGKQEALDYLAPHCAFFSFGENLGHPGCRVPVPQPFAFRPTRQPVVMELWENHGQGDGTVFTTIGNWRQPWRQVSFEGEIYRWSKHFEFQKFLQLPRRVSQPFELALSSYTEQDQRLLESNGWRVRSALHLSLDLDDYRRYIGSSRGEFTVAKDQNVRLLTGWFSDRAVTYLAAGRPVITQETGFSGILPTGAGLFAFQTMDDIVAAVEAINADYDRHRRAAWTIASECFSHDVVLTRLLRDLGLSPQPRAPAPKVASSALPADLVITPISRWPTRLPESTLRVAAALPIPVARPREKQRSPRASIVIVTHNGLPFTRMCLAALLSDDWLDEDELIVVDNGSTDGTREYLHDLRRLNPFVRAESNERNQGFAVANNQGLARATGDWLILLNNDTLPTRGWRDGLARWLEDPTVGLVGPVTNRTCNEAQIDAPYRTFVEMEQFARSYTQSHHRQSRDLAMLAMFCLALRRDVFARVGPLDERFEIGMFEDDDYALRVRQLGYRVVCAEDVFVHHFGQASLGELCASGEYNRLLESNRRRFEAKWGVTWQPHGRRLTLEYQQLRERIREAVMSHLPAGATVAVISKGDPELLRLEGRRGWHFPQDVDGQCAFVYPSDSVSAIAQLEALRAKGANFLLIPEPGLWWLEHYAGFRDHLEGRYRVALRQPELCLLYDLGGAHAS